MEVTTIGEDLAKNVFQVHGVDQRGKAVLRKQTRISRQQQTFLLGGADYCSGIRPHA